MRTTWIILACLMLTSATFAEPVVRLRGAAVVPGPVVRLADVAGTEELPGSAAQVVVTTLPGEGGSGYVSAVQVESALTQAGVDVSTLKMAGSACCRVSWSKQSQAPVVAPAASAAIEAAAGPTTQPAAAAANAAPAVAQADKTAPLTLAERLLAQLSQQFNVPSGQITLTLDVGCTEVAQSAPVGDVAISSSDRAALGKRHWRVDIVSGPRHYRQYLSGIVSVQRELVVAARDIPAGATIHAEDVQLAERPDTGVPGSLSTLSVAVGQQARRMISAGIVVTSADLTAAILVHAGQKADVCYRAGSLSVKASGSALSDGKAGDRVQFEMTGGKRIAATVVAPGEALVSSGQEAPQ